MGLFSSGKNKNKAKEAKATSEKSQPLKNHTEPSKKNEVPPSKSEVASKDTAESQEAKVYPDYGRLSSEESKLVLAKRITEKINGVSNLDVSSLSKCPTVWWQAWESLPTTARGAS